MHSMAEYQYKIADQDEEFQQIHRLNYRTFVEEIPQHSTNTEKILIDRFHGENTYAICIKGERLVGMIAGRGKRPFSLDGKLPDLDSLLPAHRQPLEIRLLAVDPDERKTDVFARLIATLAAHFGRAGYDLAVISGTLRQARLYRHLGFVPFGPPVGSEVARYQPMYLDLATFNRLDAKLAMLAPPPTPMNLQPGPVEISPEVASAFKAPAISHRSAAFNTLYRSTRDALCALTGARESYLMLGSGTLANEAVAAQLSRLPGRGLILSNGEFGERLLDHARRWNLDFTAIQVPWGCAFDLTMITERLQADTAIRWLWAVSCETSTGMTNPVEALAELCTASQIALCLDAISALGAMPQRFDHVHMASAVSGKALGALPGVAIVLVNGELAPAGELPRYLDLALYADATPFTHSSNLIAALHAALQTENWAERFEYLRSTARELRNGLSLHGIEFLVEDAHASPAVTTLVMPLGLSSRQLAQRLDRCGYALAAHSDYLLERNWLQICLMGRFDAASLARLPAVIALQADRLMNKSKE